VASMKKIPCKNCICFPLCKNQAVEKTFKNEMYIRLNILYKKCKLFVKWYDRSCGFEEYPKVRGKIKECFNVSYVNWLHRDGE
jgi:hypothetical protein